MLNWCTAHVEYSSMTTLLEQALAEVQKLSPEEQDAIASLILEELADETKWSHKFAQTQDTLARLADKARADIRAGRTTVAGFDEL
jgi:DNA-binding transcriptional regulator YdaS (Cro superfamily)